jgi:hypothetical protein
MAILATQLRTERRVEIVVVFRPPCHSVVKSKHGITENDMACLATIDWLARLLQSNGFRLLSHSLAGDEQ